MPGARCARSLVCEIKSTQVVTTVTPDSPGIPRAMVLPVSFVLSPVIGPVIGLFCHRRLADTSAKLDTSVEASGPHDFAVRLFGAFVCRAKSVHRLPRRTFCDDRETPL
jgi:hypothetical protein